MVHADEGPRMVPNVAVVEAESRDRSPALGTSEHLLISRYSVNGSMVTGESEAVSLRILNVDIQVDQRLLTGTVASFDRLA